jgi:glutamine synthetase
LDGVERKLDPGEPVNENIYEFTAQDLKKRKIAVLPQNLNDALDELEEDSVLCGALGNDVAQEFIRLKRMEWVEYQRHVSQWEIERYLEFF